MSERQVQVNLENKILLITLFFGFLVAFALIEPNISGYFVAKEDSSTIPLNLTMNDSFIQEIELEHAPTSLRLSGSVIGNATVKAYLETPSALYLIFDEQYLSQEGRIEITALAVADTPKNESKNEDKKEKEEKDSKKEGLNETPQNEKDTNEAQNEVNGSLQGGANETQINESESLTAEISLNETEETKTVITFDSVCRETCSLVNVSRFIKLKVEVTNGSLNLSSLTYTYAVEEVNLPPVLVRNISDMVMTENQNYSFDLEPYFNDSDPLIYSSIGTQNISVYIEGSSVILEPQTGLLGNESVIFAAFDGLNTTFSNNVSISIKERELPIKKNDSSVQVYAIIGQPVKIVRTIELNQSVENLSINISAKAQNISVRKVEDNQLFEIDDSKITIRLNDSEKELGEMVGSETIDEALGITGAVIAVPEGEGFLTRWLKKGNQITGNVVADLPDEAANVSINLTAEDNAVLVINDNVTEVEVEFYLPAPEASEKNVSKTVKNVTVSSVISYNNVLTFTNIPETHQQSVRIYWYVNESDYRIFNNLPVIDENNLSLNLSSEPNIKMDITQKPDFLVSFLDTNNDSLVDQVQWLTPHLSNQTFEVAITVLDLQSYPVIGGNWTVRFLTTGTANLTIMAINQTTYTEEHDDNGATIDDLEILDIKCGNTTWYNKEGGIFNESVFFIASNGSSLFASDATGQSMSIQGIRLQNYSCAEEAYHTVRVITEGIHNQMFVFGNVSAYANNLAQYPPVAEVIRFADNNLTASFYVINAQ